MSHPTQSWTLTSLGTAAAAPTAERHTSAHWVDDGQQAVLLDAGDGVSSRIAALGGLGRLAAVCISHAHVDHWSGLPALLRLRQLQSGPPLPVYCPKPETLRLTEVLRHYEVDDAAIVTGLQPGDERALPLGGSLRVAQADHRVPALAWRLTARPPAPRLSPRFHHALTTHVADAHRGALMQTLRRGEAVEIQGQRWTPDTAWDTGPRTGSVLVYSGDTRPSASVRALARDADLLLHEATYLDAHQESAQTWGHSTAREAATVAQDSGVARLLLTHWSNRYSPDELNTLVEEAASVFTHGPVGLVTELEPVRVIPRTERVSRDRGGSPIVGG